MTQICPVTCEMGSNDWAVLSWVQASSGLRKASSRYPYPRCARARLGSSSIARRYSRSASDQSQPLCKATVAKEEWASAELSSRAVAFDAAVRAREYASRGDTSLTRDPGV